MTVVHVGPFSQVGGISYVANMIRGHASKCESPGWIDIDSTVSKGDRSSWVRRVWHTLRICLEIWRRISDVDGLVVLHVHTGSYSSFYEKSLFALVGEICGANSVLHVHGGAFKKFYQNSGGGERFVVKRLLRVPRAILVLSDSWAGFFREIAPPENIYVIENGVDLAFPNTGDASTYANCGMKEEGFNVIFLGRIEQEKGCWEILKAAKELDKVESIRFYLYGEATSTEAMTAFEDWVRKQSLHNVSFCGTVTGVEKHQVFQWADLFILPSWAEGMPISMLEAMAYGLPVVITRVGAIPEVIGPQNGILIDPKNPQQLASAIESLYNDEDTRRSMGKVNRRKVEESFSVERYMERLSSIYKAVISADR